MANESDSQRSSQLSSNKFLIAGVVILAVIVVVLSIVLYRSSNRPTQTSNTNAANVNLSAPTLSTQGKNVEAKLLQGAELSPSDIDGIPESELRILRNVVFARYGRKYEKPGLGDYFFTTTWYKPNENYNDNMLTATDKYNVNIILAREKPESSLASAPTPPPESSSSNSSDFSSLSEDDIRRIINEKGIWTPGVTYYGDAKEVKRVGPYNEEGKYFPVEAIVNVTPKKRYLIKVRVFKDDFGDIVVRGSLYG